MRYNTSADMSGHSHYATIHRQKETKDAARGNVFSKLARAITIAVKSGGGDDPNSNFKLRVEIDKARAVNMPKDNIERAVARAKTGEEVLEEVNYEGFGPGGISVIVKVTTDNRNRTSQEIKNLFERNGGNLAGPGAVLFNFENKGYLLVEKTENPESQILKLIDLGVEDVEEIGDGIDVYTLVDKLSQTRDDIEKLGYIIKETELIMKPKNLQTVGSPKEGERALNFLEALEEHDDVQKVFTNLDIPNV